MVVPVYGGLSLLREQLTALSAQTYEKPFEVVLSDNQPNSSLEQWLTEFVRTTHIDERITVRRIGSADGTGAAYARNRGVAEAVGDLIAFVDADDVARPDWLEHLVAASRRADLVAGPLDTSRINAPAVAEWRPSAPLHEPSRTPGYFDSASTANMAVSRTAHEAIGGFDENARWAGEDNDYSWRVQLAGFSMAFEPRAIMDYRLRRSRRELWKQMVAYGQGDVANHVKHRPLGHPGMNHPFLFPIVVVSLALRNPLLPRALTRMSRGRWIYYVAYEFGKIKGSIENRVWCI